MFRCFVVSSFRRFIVSLFRRFVVSLFRCFVVRWLVGLLAWFVRCLFRYFVWFLGDSDLVLMIAVEENRIEARPSLTDTESAIRSEWRLVAD